MTTVDWINSLLHRADFSSHTRTHL